MCVDKTGYFDKQHSVANAKLAPRLHVYLPAVTLTLWSLEQVAILRPWKS